MKNSAENLNVIWPTRSFCLTLRQSGLQLSLNCRSLPIQRLIIMKYILLQLMDIYIHFDGVNDFSIDNSLEESFREPSRLKSCLKPYNLSVWGIIFFSQCKCTWKESPTFDVSSQKVITRPFLSRLHTCHISCSNGETHCAYITRLIETINCLYICSSTSGASSICCITVVSRATHH